jgi:uncharacterized membrane protein
VRWIVLALCAIGLYVSFVMQGKANRARRGELSEPSVVQTPRATIFGSVPNSLFGIVYYTLLAVSTLFFDVPTVRLAAVMAAGAAGAVSLYLAYSLLFVTRMSCVNCWTGHVVNWMLLALLLFAH